MKAIISPTCMVPLSMALPPNQTISRLVPFMMRVIKGIMATMARLVNNWVPISSRLALSKRSSSNFSRLNARTGNTPLRISRLTRFSRSTSVCMILNLGMATFIRKRMSSSSKATSSTTIQERPERLPMTCSTPPMPRMGA